MSTYTDASLIYYPSGYKESKAYSLKPTDGSGDLTFTRASTATRVNESGLIEEVAANVPRLDNSQGGCSTLLLEPQRTNLLLRSEEFNIASWSKTNVSVLANSVTSPSGLLDADVIVENSISSQHRLLQYVTISNATTYTTSLYVKRVTGTRDFGIINTVSGQRVYFNLTTGTVGSQVQGTGTITDVGNGWYRCTVTGTSTGTSANVFLCLTNGTDAGNETYLGDGVSSLAFYAAQTEQGSYPTSYIPTTSTAVTRVADESTLINVYTNNFITASGGTWFVELKNNIPLTRDANTVGLNLDTTFAENGWAIRNNSAFQRLTISRYISNSRANVYITTSDTCKIAIKWDGTNADIFENGVKVVSAFPFNITNMQFLNGVAGDVPKNIQSTMLFPTPLSDSDLITLTTL